MISTITLAGQPLSLVEMPCAPAPRNVEFTMFDAVALVSNPFNTAAQRQAWPGGDRLTATVTLPPLTIAQMRRWKVFLMSLRGMQNALQLYDYDAQTPEGAAQGSPVVDGSVVGTNKAGATQLYTKGWTASVHKQLIEADNFQVGYRLHTVVDHDVDADGDGKGVISIWPSLREQPTDGTPIVLNQPKGLFCLAKNDRTWSRDVTRLSRLSIQLQEYR